MRRLLILRHAKSDWGEPGLSDHARPLNARGRAAAVAMGGFMRLHGLLPDLVLLSSSRRTRQTLEGLDLPAAGLGEVPLDALYLAEPDTILAVLREAPAAAAMILLIGHNPGLHELAMALAGDHSLSSDRHISPVSALAEGFPTATLAEFEIDAPWAGLARRGGRLIRLTHPRDLPEMAR